MSSLTLFLLFAFFSVAEAKFTRGDEFQYANIEGNLTITCKNRTKTITCRDVFLSPWPYDVYIGPRNSNAQDVQFHATVGTDVQTTSVSYNGKTGRSSDVNLGVYSLFQKPLLKVGENTVRASLIGKSGNVLSSELFNISVSRGKSRSCDSRETHSDNLQDCEHTYTLCQMYFRNQNYCR